MNDWMSGVCTVATGVWVGMICYCITEWVWFKAQEWWYARH